MPPSRDITAHLLCIGDELLIGQTVNTNAAWMGEQLNRVGFHVTGSSVIGDDRAAILEALGAARTDVVLITGGLGPTNDDITKGVLCEFFGSRLVRHPDIEARIAALFERTGRDPMEVNRAQADLPENCIVVRNPRGTASGMWFDVAAPERSGEGGQENRVFVSLPGVPYEMKAMMEADVLPRLVARFAPPVIVHRTVLTTGMGESHLAQRIAAWEDSLAVEHIKLAYLPSPGSVRLRLSAYAEADGDAARARVAAKTEELYRMIPELIFGEGEVRLAAVVGKLLKEREQTLALAESCTGGNIARHITGVPGSSAYFVGGVVSYANAVKMVELGIPEDMLELNGAVSQPVVERMALGVREALRTHWSIATSGIAGPDGGTPEKPVGLVWIAVAGPDGVRSAKAVFPGTRKGVIERASMAGLNALRLRLIGSAAGLPS